MGAGGMEAVSCIAHVALNICSKRRGTVRAVATYGALSAGSFNEESDNEILSILRSGHCSCSLYDKPEIRSDLQGSGRLPTHRFTAQDRAEMSAWFAVMENRMRQNNPTGRFSLNPSGKSVLSVRPSCAERGAYRDRHESRCGMRWTRLCRVRDGMAGRASRPVSDHRTR